MTGFLIFALGLMCSRYGAIRLGPDDARPEFSRLTWFAMLFSAGMGIGLLFYSVAEPLMHYGAPPVGEGKTAAAVGNQAWALLSFIGDSTLGLCMPWWACHWLISFSSRTTTLHAFGI